jgi:hypothetical protein
MITQTIQWKRCWRRSDVSWAERRILLSQCKRFRIDHYRGGGLPDRYYALALIQTPDGLRWHPISIHKCYRTLSGAKRACEQYLPKRRGKVRISTGRSPA